MHTKPLSSTSCLYCAPDRNQRTQQTPLYMEANENMATCRRR